MPTYSNKGGRRYYYYICSKDTKRAISECPVKQIPAGDIEELVRKQLQKMFSDISLVMRFAEQSGMSPLEVVECFREEFWNEITPGEYNRLLLLLVGAFRWQALIDSGNFSNVHELARAIGKDDAYVSRIIRFTLLAPEIIHAVLAGKINKSISTEKLKQSLPILWEEQKKMFDIE